MSVTKSTGAVKPEDSRAKPDALPESAAKQKISGTAGSDTLVGGSGSDTLKGKAGNDTLVYNMSQNLMGTDRYDGGVGVDTLRLEFTSAQWMRADVQRDIARFQRWLADMARESDHVRSQDDRDGHDEWFEFKAFRLEVRRVETLEIRIDGVIFNPNDRPVDARDDAFTMTEDSALQGNVLGNDSIPDGLRTVELVSAPSRGQLVLGIHGEFVYTPGADFDFLAEGATALEHFSYRVIDADGDSDIATVNISVVGTNDGPVAIADFFQQENNAVALHDVLENDTDPDAGDTKTLVSAVALNGGVASIVDGQVQFDPGHDFDALRLGEAAQAQISYTMRDAAGSQSTALLTLSVAGTNAPPTALADAFTRNAVVGAKPFVGNVLTNDSDSNPADVLTVLAPTGGVVFDTRYCDLTLFQDGTLLWDVPVTATPGDEPDSVFVRALGQGEQITVTADIFGNPLRYTVSDGQQTSSATFSLTLIGQNDAPSAVADYFVTDEDHVLSVGATGVLANDSDPDTNDVLSVENLFPITTSLGATVQLARDGSFSYDPRALAGVQALGEGASFEDSFSVSIVDSGGRSAVSTVSILIAGVNDAPVAKDMTLLLLEDKVLTIGIGRLGSDVDANEVLTASIGVEPTHGTASIDVDGNVVYNPNAEYSGNDEFHYLLSDSHGASAEGIIRVMVTAVDDPTQVESPLFNIGEGGSITGNVLDFISDPDTPLALSALATQGPIATAHGWYSILPDGTFTYENNFDAGLNGQDSFDFTVTNANVLKLTGTVHVAIEAYADKPIAIVPMGNLNFEEGRDGWTKSTTSYPTFLQAINADLVSEGDMAARILASSGWGRIGQLGLEQFLQANGDLGIAFGELDGKAGPGVNNNIVSGSAIARHLQVEAGDVLSFDWRFQTGNPYPQGTYAFVAFNGEIHRLAGIADLGTSHDSGWRTTEIVMPVSGSLPIGFGVAETITAADNSLLLDNLRINGVQGDVRGIAGAGFDLTLGAFATDTDGSEVISIMLSGLPQGVGLSAGIDLGNGQWSLAPTDLPGLQMISDGSYTGTFTATFEVTATEVSNGASARDVKQFDVIIQAAGNHVPQGVTDTVFLTEDSTALIPFAQLLANDLDADGDALSVHWAGLPGKWINAQPMDTDGDGKDDAMFLSNRFIEGFPSNFYYNVSDGVSHSRNVEVKVSVIPVNDAPVAIDDNYTVATGQSFSTDIITGLLGPGTNFDDYDTDSVIQSAVLVEAPHHGELVLNTDGSFTYAADPGFVGVDVFTYSAFDGLLYSTPASVHIDVLPQPGPGGILVAYDNYNVIGTPNDDVLIAPMDDTFGGSLSGQAGNDVLAGNIGPDAIQGGLGDDWLKGGEAQDTFWYQSGDTGLDRIVDFGRDANQVLGNDVLNLSQLLTSTPTANNLDEFFRLSSATGGGTLIEVDSNGGADAFQPLVILENVDWTSSLLQDFYLNGNLVVS